MLISAIKEENDWAQNIIALVLESHSSLLPCPSAKCRALKNEMDLKYMCGVQSVALVFCTYITQYTKKKSERKSTPLRESKYSQLASKKCEADHEVIALVVSL